MLNNLTKKRIIILISLALLTVAVVLSWFFIPKKGTISEKQIEEAEEQKKIKQLEEIERQIEATKDELKKIENISPQERAKRAKEREILAAQKAEADLKIEGVEIIISNAKKLVRNIAQGYTMEVPKNLLIARSISSDNLEFHDPKTMCQDPSCEPVLRVVSEGINTSVLPLSQWFDEEEKKAASEAYSPREKLTINGQTIYKITESLPPIFDGYYYYWGKGEKVYYIRVSKLNDSIYREFVESFRPE